MILHFDSFDTYGSVGQLVPPFQTFSGTLDSTSRTGAKCALLAAQSMDFNLGADYTAFVVVGYACRFEAFDLSRQRHFLEVYSDGSGVNLQFYVSLDTVLNCFTLYNASNTVLKRSKPISSDRCTQYNFLEFKFVVHGSTGTVEMRFNEEVILSFTGNTHGAGLTSARLVRVASTNAGSAIRVDDFYVLDSTGSDLNDYLGDIHVEVSALTADDTPLQWTPSTGTNHTTLVGGTAPNDAANIAAPSSGLKDTFSVNDLASGIIDPIYAVLVNTRAEQD